MMIAGVALVSLAGVVLYDVICRYLLNSPSLWGHEISAYLMACVVLFGAAHTLSIDAHIRVDVIYDNLTGKRRAIADVVAWSVGTLFCAVLTYQSSVMAFRSFNNSARSFDLSIPLAIPQALVPAGTLALMIEAMLLLYRAVLRLLQGDK